MSFLGIFYNIVQIGYFQAATTAHCQQIKKLSKQSKTLDVNNRLSKPNAKPVLGD